MNDDERLGHRLYRLVEEYAALGPHRSGTAGDARTGDWFAAELERRGGRVERQAFSLDRYEATATVTIDGWEVPSLPLFYEGTGAVASDRPHVAAVATLDGDRASSALEATIAEARAAGAAVAVITCVNPLSELQVPNRAPSKGDGIPVLLVPGAVAAALGAGRVNVDFPGAIIRGTSANVIAKFGQGSEAPIVIATPLSGWFGCAAERGTGIAVAIELASRIAATRPVLVVGSSGHEILPYVGLEAFLLRHETLAASLVAHLGANLALAVRADATGELRLAPGVASSRGLPASYRALKVRMQPDVCERLTPIFAEIDLPPIVHPAKWSGEAQAWARATDASLLSSVGMGPAFHTPADVPADATSAVLLDRVCSAIAAAIEVAVPAPDR